MSMTYTQAIAALSNPQYQTLEGLRTLVNQVSVAVPGAAPNATTLLYSGLINGAPSYLLAESISATSSGKVITINQTPASTFLNSADFRAALMTAAGTESTNELKKLMDGVANSNGTRINGMWDIVSENLAKSATGDVRTLTAFAESGKTFAATELPALLSNSDVTHINGIPETKGSGLPFPKIM